VGSVFLAIASLLVSTTPLNAQVASASITGTVRDPSGAVIPQATIVLHNVATGVDRTVVTNETGSYVMLYIPPGDYTLEVAKAGFATVTQARFTLVVNQNSVFDFLLPVAATGQKVTVEAVAPTLQTAAAALGTAIVGREVNDLPLNGRNFTELLTLTPGVNPANVSQNATGWSTNPIGSFTFPSVNGMPNRSNYFMLDGTNDNGDYVSTYAVPPIIDAIQEFKVESHADNARVGGAMGGVVDVVTKSGTNQLHGTAWDFLRNKSLDAQEALFTSVPKQHFTQNQFGGTIGGPVVLPRYNGRNHTFFFFGYQGYRKHLANQSLYRVPTAQELSGDLSDEPHQIYNPFSTRPDPNNPNLLIRDPFANNQIPSNLLNPNSLQLTKIFYPAPVTTPFPQYNGLDTSPNIYRSDETNARVDEQLGTRDSLWFRWSRFSEPNLTSGPVGRENSDTVLSNNISANWVHSFSPNTLLHLQFARLKMTDITNQLHTNHGKDIFSKLTIGQKYLCGFNTSAGGGCLLPITQIAGNFPYVGEEGGSLIDADVYQLMGDLSVVHGKHSFSFGYDVNTSNDGFGQFFTQWLFDSFPTSNPQMSGTGSALASFLLGVPSTSNYENALPLLHGGWVDGVYFQDQWKVTGRLTLNLGVRYDLTLLPILGSAKDGSNANGNMDFNRGVYILETLVGSCDTLKAAPCIPGGTLPANVIVSPDKHLVNNTHDNIQPRIGLAYRLNDRTVIRAGYGRVFDNWAYNAQSVLNTTGTWPSVTIFSEVNQNISKVDRPIEDSLGFGAGNTFLPAPTPFDQVTWWRDPNTKNPYSDQWNFGVQRQIDQATSLTVSYVGSHGSRLPVGGIWNLAPTPGPGKPQDRAPFPYIAPSFYDRSVGRGNYNALQVTLDRKYRAGLTYLISYTWEKSIDISCSGYVGAEGCEIQDPYHLNRDRSVSGYDVPHIFTASAVYALPFGRGKRFANTNQVVSALAGGWQVNGIVTFSSSPPFHVAVAGDIANTGNVNCCTFGGYERLNLVGDWHPVGGCQPDHMFNTDAFAVPATFTFGNVGRFSMRACALRSLDLSVFRDFRIPSWERGRLQFRAEAFNLTNTPTWAIPDANISDGPSYFGKSFSSRNPAREVQLALKLIF
jgi:outer membrane receptor protein involved in Fe transport